MYKKTFIICGCNKKTFIVKMGAYFCIVGALYQNKRYLTIESLYEHLSFPSCEKENELLRSYCVTFLPPLKYL